MDKLNIIENNNPGKMKILKERARLLKQKYEKTEDTGKYFEGLEFRLGKEIYVFDTQYINEVIPLKDITPLPCSPDFVQGIINVRGKIVAVINTVKFLNLSGNGITNLNRVIVLKQGEMELGILADEIIGNRHIFPEELQETIPTLKGVQKDYLMGITNDRAIVINVKELLADERITVYEEV